MNIIDECCHIYGPPEFDEWMRIVYEELWAYEECEKCGHRTPMRYVI